MRDGDTRNSWRGTDHFRDLFMIHDVHQTQRTVPFSDELLQERRNHQAAFLGENPNPLIKIDFDNEHPMWHTWSVFACSRCAKEWYVLQGHTSAVSGKTYQRLSEDGECSGAFP